MGCYGERVLPHIVNFLCGLKAADPLRQRVCDGLEGEVLEIGFGSGLNVPFYPAAVTRVAAVEPSDVGWKLAGKRLSAARVPVERSGLDGQSLPFEDNSLDSALSTWTMCTIPDIATALSEVRRVLKPGGQAALRRARAGTRRGGAALATPARPRAEAPFRRLPPHPADS